MNKIVIGADFVPTETNVKYFVNGSVSKLVGEELLLLLNKCSYRIFNLETPLTDIRNPIDKWGPNLIAPTLAAKTYGEIGVNLFTLANNHIMDQGVQGLESTILTLSKMDIAIVGAGENLELAARSHIFDFSNKRIGVYACTEHEFSSATNNSSGANPFDPLNSLDHIVSLKNEVDYVIVLYHGGKEHFRYPSPYLNKVCHHMIDKGADLVICQHSHCIGCKEDYKNGLIVYGQGNFLFDHSNLDCWQTSLLVTINDDFFVDFIPIVKQECFVRLAEPDQSSQILSEFESRSQEIKSSEFIEKVYNEYANDYFYFYLRAIAGKQSALSRVINKATNGWYYKKRLRKLYDKNTLLRLINYIECEAHRELLLSAIQNNWSD